MSTTTTRPRMLVARGPHLDPDDPFDLGGTAPARVEVVDDAAIDAAAAVCFPDIYGPAAAAPSASLQEVSR